MSRGSNDQNSPAEPARKSVMWGTIGLAVVVTAGVWYFRRPAAPNQSSVVPDNASHQTTRLESRRPSAARQRAVEPVSPAAVSPIHEPPPPNPIPATAPPMAPPRPQPSAYTRALVENLSTLDVKSGVITPEQAQFWKQEYAKLLKEGAQAVPAIREILEKNIDLKFAGLQGAAELGAYSLRFSMLEALRQIGGPEATGLALEVMQTTVRPEEVALIARDLDASAPEQYRDAAVAAARAALLKAAQNPAAVDASPLFEVFQKFGGANAIADLEQAATKWNYYGPIVLATLADGAGIPSLVRMAENKDNKFDSSSKFAQRMLAEMAPQNPDAAHALLDLVSNNKVSSSAWLGVASALSGEQTYYGVGYLNNVSPPPGANDPKGYHLAGTDQNFSSMNLSPTWTTEQVQKQVALIDQLRAANQTAAKMLEGTRAALAARLAQ